MELRQFRAETANSVCCCLYASCLFCKKRGLLFPRNASSNKSRITRYAGHAEESERQEVCFTVQKVGGKNDDSGRVAHSSCRSVHMPDMLFLEHSLKCSTVFCVM